MKKLILAVLVLMIPVVLSGDGKKKDPPSMAGKPASSPSNEKSAKKAASKSTPPGLAKKTELPPGLAKKFGEKPDGAAYVAFDPKNTSRAWFLIDGKWKLEDGFDAKLRGEVKASLAFPAVEPPVPLPEVKIKLQVVKFE